MKKQNEVLVAIGIISFIASIIGIVIMIISIFQGSESGLFESNSILPEISLIALGIIFAIYIRMTNFGRIKESDLEKKIRDKKILKEKIEIVKLEKELKKAENSK